MPRRALPVAAIAFATLLPLAARGDGIPETVDAARIPHYRRVSPSLATAGQPTAGALAEVGALGFRTVVDLRGEHEPGALADEAEILRKAGVGYLRVPITAKSFSLDDVVAVERVLDDPAAGPVLLHCSSANRAGAVLAVVAAQKGEGVEDAIATGKEAGLSSEAMTEAVRRVIGALAK